MTEWLANIRDLFRENPRMWWVLAVALLFGGFAVWTFYGGFSFEIGRFFAADCETISGQYCRVGGCYGGENEASGFSCYDPGAVCCVESGGGGPAAPTANISVSPATTTSGGTVNVSWSSTNATTCTTTAGTFSTGGQANGSATDTISPLFTGTAQFRVRCSGPGGSADSNIAVVTVTAGGGGGSAGAPVDPSGACVFKTNFNAPEGAWFCMNLQCQLDGNPSGGQEFPPKGPASSLAINVYNRSTQAPDPALGPIFVRYILDATPKCSSGGECYPPKDPLWTCTRPDGKEVDLGRNGSDFYDCYRPIVRVYDSVPVTCCANTGLSGDCYTIREQAPGVSASPAPGVSPSSSPTPSSAISPSPVSSATPASDVECAPQRQTVLTNRTVRLDADGGNGVFSWSVLQGGRIVSGGNEYIGIQYASPGLKTVRVRSAGDEDTCEVEVITGQQTRTPTPISSAEPYPTPAQAGLTVLKTARNVSVGDPIDRSSVMVYPGQTVTFKVRVTNYTTLGVDGIRMFDTVPAGMSYRRGSTTIDARPAAEDTVTTSGLSLKLLQPRETVVIQWSAVANQTTLIPPGPNLTSPEVRVTAANTPDTVLGIAVTVYGSSGGSDFGDIPTGPGSAILISLIIAAGAALLYSGYTRSASFRTSEAEAVSRDQGPMDFRS